MISIRWTAEGSDPFVSAIEHIREENPSAAQRVAEAILKRVDSLKSFPGIGRPGEAMGTRELVCPPYIVVYRANPEVVEILYFWHGSQDWRF